VLESVEFCSIQYSGYYLLLFSDLSGGRYVIQDDGLVILNATDTDAGNYTCRAEVDQLGNYAERYISVDVNSAFFLLFWLFCT